MDIKLNVAIYCRLSREDGDSIESSSIKTQKDILSQYANENKWNIYKYYVDDGYSGGNFNRPAFKELIEDIEDKKINILLTKDLSRLGRNYIEAGYYTEEYFPSKNVRYIAVNDNYDSLKEDNDLTPFKNIINQWYLKDLSKKIKSSHKNRMRKGLLPKSSYPMYGYLHDENHDRIINEETAPAVRLIFKMHNEGKTIPQIIKSLKENGFVTPSYYLYDKFGVVLKNMKSGEENEKYGWTEIMIQKILKDYQYTGALILGKTTSKSYKTHLKKAVPKEEQFIYEDKYPAIISKEVFQEAMRIKASRSKNKVTGEMNKYENLIKCPTCSKTMSFANVARSKKNKERRVYRCTRPNCPNCMELRKEVIDMIINKELSNLINLCLKDETKLLNYAMSYKDSRDKTNNPDEETIKKLKERNRKLDLLIEKLFERSITEEIPKETYTKMMASYKKEYDTNRKQIKELENKESKKEDKNYIDLTYAFINKLKQIKVTEFTKEVISSIIESITIKRTFPKSQEFIVKIKYKKIPDLLEDYINEENEQ